MSDLSWLGPVEPHLRVAAALLQPWVDQLLRAPEQTGWAIAALGALMLLLGTQGQRPLMAAAAALFFAWGERRLGLQLPGPALAFPLGAGAVAGIFPRAARSAICAAAGWAAGLSLARTIGQPPVVSAAIGSIAGFLLGWLPEGPARILLPPVGAAIALTAAAARLLVGVRARHPQLGEAAWLLVIAGAAAVVLVPVALEREAISARRRKKRVEAALLRKKEAELAAKKERMSRYLNRAG